MILDNQHSLLFFLPELTLTIGMLLVILCDITLKGLRNRLNPILTVFTLVLAAYYTFQLDQTAPRGISRMLAIDGFAQFLSSSCCWLPCWLFWFRCIHPSLPRSIRANSLRCCWQ
jgi:NADH:ubiquinone oxidoreductase subunit 2 (subunit N)